MKVYDIQAILAALGPVGEVKTAEEDAAAFPQLASYDGGGVSVGRFAGEGGPWELHPDADELLHVLEGELAVAVLTGDQASTVTVKPGCFVVVPRGHWHHVAGRPTVRALGRVAADRGFVRILDGIGGEGGGRSNEQAHGF